MLSKSALVALATATTVAAHAHMSGLVADGKYFEGYTPNFQYMNPVPKVPAWSAGGYGQGGIAADNFTKENIICHDQSKPGQAYADVAAGSEVKFEWTPWPEGHKGPVLTYIAPCDGDCITVDKMSLKFVKIAEKGLVKGGEPAAQQWATDELVANNNTDTVTIPENLKAGNYVIRNEIIALHQAGTAGGAQPYPQCANLKVTGSGSAFPSNGISATEFYKPESNGIVYNIAARQMEYPIPGPPMWDQAGAQPAKKLVKRFEA
ncbi:lytic polysaccharide monooxygenase [Aulographum hederae CBS 113979]|uniref:Lytic polysaccharide monooxygenase n=1 Tax=Aulographum hederae CBS 113979 TaxID=1176131 RepID=A0A6G1H530_9PEZI|nr:lytic polysaccharide monooxygenase [Aulographum hederae CBS 113979]